MMLYINYENSGPCCFRHEDFLKLHFENLISNLVTYFWSSSTLALAA